MARVYEIKARYRGHFFDRGAMRFFGDKMSSFGVRDVDGETFLYRKPSATVNVFGRTVKAGWDYFGAWKVIENEDGSVSLERVDDETKRTLYKIVR